MIIGTIFAGLKQDTRFACRRELVAAAMLVTAVSMRRATRVDSVEIRRN